MDVDATIELRRDTREVAAARRFVRARLQSSPSWLVDDAALAVSELVTNAVEHGVAGPIVVGVGRDDDGVVVQVTSVGPSPDVDAPVHWSAAPPHAGRGRGLGIVAGIASAVELDRAGDRLTTSVRLRA